MDEYASRLYALMVFSVCISEKLTIYIGVGFATVMVARGNFMPHLSGSPLLI